MLDSVSFGMVEKFFEMFKTGIVLKGLCEPFEYTWGICDMVWNLVY